jgi:uncharacterized protein (TIGR02391 family)
MTIAAFSQNQLEQISRAISDAFTHTELSGLLAASNIPENGGTPKWQRTLLALSAKQGSDKCGNNVAGFIQRVMDPVRFVGRVEIFTQSRAQLNAVLAFSALQLGDDGKLRHAATASTLTEAHRMADELQAELRRRGVHCDVLAFCRAELLEASPPNYFHAVLEATKSVAQKIRDKTGLTGDAGELVDGAFSVKKPLLAINSLQTDSEKAEHTGFANMMKGMFGTFRNPTGHAPRILWRVDKQDALDLLSLVSYLHRRLDQAVRTHNAP